MARARSVGRRTCHAAGLRAHCGALAQRTFARCRHRSRAAFGRGRCRSAWAASTQGDDPGRRYRQCGRAAVQPRARRRGLVFLHGRRSSREQCRGVGRRCGNVAGRGSCAVSAVAAIRIARAARADRHLVRTCAAAPRAVGECGFDAWCPGPGSNRHDLAANGFSYLLRLSPPHRLRSGSGVRHDHGESCDCVLGPRRPLSTPSPAYLPGLGSALPRA